MNAPISNAVLFSMFAAKPEAATLIDLNNSVGGYTYPVMSMMPAGFRGYIVSRKFGQEDSVELSNMQIFAATESTLRWVRGDGVNDLYILDTSNKIMASDDFFAHTGLELGFSKNEMVTAKRVSRFMRGFRYAKFFEPEDILAPRIKYVDFGDERKNRAADGAGVIRKSYMIKFAKSTSFKDERGTRWIKDLLHSERLEVTYVSADGSDKNHSLVLDDVLYSQLYGDDSDMVMMMDTKSDLKLDGKVFLGLSPVHGQSSIRLDVQSLINLKSVFTNDLLKGYWEDKSAVFVKALESGDAGNVLAAMQFYSEQRLDSAMEWSVAEFLVSGGKLKESAWMTRQVGMQHQKQLESNSMNYRFPVPGMREYIFPDFMVGMDIARGEIMIVHAKATVFMNWEDVCDYASIEGGWDDDDAAWLASFKHIGETVLGSKLGVDLIQGEIYTLAWRSPNEYGEVIAMKLAKGSDEIKWINRDGEKVSGVIEGDLSLLIRKDFLNVTYAANLVPAAKPHVQKYSFGMWQGIIRMISGNASVLGSYINLLMSLGSSDVFLGTYAAPTEDIIDGCQKDGRDMKPVTDFIKNIGVMISQEDFGTGFSKHVLTRLPSNARVKLVENWMDELVGALEDHIKEYMETVEAISNTRMVNPVVANEIGLKWYDQGKALRSFYGQALNKHTCEGEVNFDAVDAELEGYLSRWSPSLRKHIVFGAALSCYGRSVANGRIGDAILHTKACHGYYMEGLRHSPESGVGTPEWDKLNACTNLMFNTAKSKNDPEYWVIRVKMVWFTSVNNDRMIHGHSTFESYRDVDAETKSAAVNWVDRAAPSLLGMEVMLHEGAILGPTGRLVGKYVSSRNIPVDRARIVVSLADRGDLDLVVVSV